MSGDRFRYLYGPVPSRRLGRSLGVDLVPFKTCTYDCIYCQLGPTTNKTVCRKEYVPADDVIMELERKLASGSALDYISLAGSGEPTLNSAIGPLIEKIRNLTKIPVAVLTNGSLLWMPEVQDALMQADLVIPSLDAGDNRQFQYINRPHEDLDFDRMFDGINEFSRRFTGQVWLEVFLVEGTAGSDSEVRKIAALAKKINPAHVQLNTVSRPPAESYAVAVSRERMNILAQFFGEKTEVIGGYSPKTESLFSDSKTAKDSIAALLSRRPCTLTDISLSLNIHPTETTKYLDMLIREGRVQRSLLGDQYFYSARETENHGKGDARS